MAKKKTERKEEEKKPHKNSNNAIGNFVIYGLWVFGKFWKFGKADADRTTKDGTPLRIHQQISQLALMGIEVIYDIFERMYNVTTKNAKDKEDEYIKQYKRKHGKNPPGNP